MMSMIDSFFNVRKDSRAIFEGLYIMKRSDFCKEWMNSRPVLFISLKDAEGNTFDLAYDKLRNCIADFCKKIPDIAGNALTNENDRKLFARLMSNTASDAELQCSLKMVLDGEFSEYFGFTDVEVRALLEAAGRSDKEAVVREWYDGYVFGTSHVYCPWDVINYTASLRTNPNARPKAFWKDSSHNGILRTFVGRTEFDVADKFETLMNGGTVMQTITDMLTYDTLHASEDNLWSVLLMTGYVTKACPEDDGDTVSLRIPNKEVATIFQDTVVSLFRDTIDKNGQKSMMEALWNGDEVAAGKAVSDLLWNTISYNDYHEDYYHAFLAGVFVGCGYLVESNKEKGLGRPDIVLKDKKHRRAIIIEAKKSANRADMEKDCGRALEQVDTRKYAEGFYGYTQVLCYGIAFFQKEALVRKG